MKRWILVSLVLILGAGILPGCARIQATEVPIVVPTQKQRETASEMPLSTAVLPTLTPDPDVIYPEDEFAYSQLRRLGRGINLGNALEAGYEGEWGVVLEEEYFRLIAEAGFDSVRVPIAWSKHADKESPYTIEPEFVDRVDWVVEQALKNNLMAILDFHHFDEIHDSPRTQHDRFLAIWEQVAQRYQDAPESVIFEVLNEPNGTLAATVWNEYAAEAIQVIRRTNPERTIVVGPGQWNSAQGLVGMILPENDRNLIVTFHFYEPFAFTHQGAEWVTNPGTVGTKWSGTDQEKNNVLIYLDLAQAWGRKYRRPIFLGEFGAYGKADDESRHLWTDFVARSAEEKGFAWAYWEFCAGFGAYDPEARLWREPILSALIPEP